MRNQWIWPIVAALLLAAGKAGAEGLGTFVFAAVMTEVPYSAVVTTRGKVMIGTDYQAPVKSREKLYVSHDRVRREMPPGAAGPGRQVYLYHLGDMATFGIWTLIPELEIYYADLAFSGIDPDSLSVEDRKAFRAYMRQLEWNDTDWKLMYSAPSGTEATTHYRYTGSFLGLGQPGDEADVWFTEHRIPRKVIYKSPTFNARIVSTIGQIDVGPLDPKLFAIPRYYAEVTLKAFYLWLATDRPGYTPGMTGEAVARAIEDVTRGMPQGMRRMDHE